MRKTLIFTLLASAILWGTPGKAIAQNGGYSLKLNVKNYSDTVAFLAYRYGDQQYLQDTVATTPGKPIHFEGKEELPGGVYTLISARKSFMFEFLVDQGEQNFTINSDTAKLTQLEFKGTPQNIAFDEYRVWVQQKGSKMAAMNKRIATLEKDSEEYKAAKAEVDALNKEVTAYQDKLIKKFDGKLVAYILKAQRDIVIPEAPEGAPSDFGYRYFKKHFWDNFDFSDDRIVRTPIYQSKLKFYFEKMIIGLPDSVNVEVDMILNKAKATPEFYKQTFVFLYQKYNASEVVCMDKVFVNLALNWYTKDLAFWATDKQLKKIRDRAKELYPIQCSMTAPNMRLVDTEGKWHDLHSTQAKYTILVFWEPDCSHCQKAVPKLIETQRKYKDQGVVFWAICTKQDIPEWREFIKEHNLDWINVTDNTTDAFLNNFREVYDIFSTPVIYVLDENKTIITKRISETQLDEWLQQQLEEEKAGEGGSTGG